MHRRTCGKVHVVQQVMPGNDHHGEQQKQRARQPDQRGQGNHADADGPNDLHVNHAWRELEGPGEVHQGEFQHHQKQPALEQKSRDVAGALILFSVQKSRQTGQQDKHRGAQVGQGPAEKQGGVSDINVHRVSHLTMQKERLAHVVQQHEDDHQPPKGVDGEQALA